MALTTLKKWFGRDPRSDDMIEVHRNGRWERTFLGALFGRDPKPDDTMDIDDDSPPAGASSAPDPRDAFGAEFDRRFAAVQAGKNRDATPAHAEPSLAEREAAVVEREKRLDARQKDLETREVLVMENETGNRLERKRLEAAARSAPAAPAPSAAPGQPYVSPQTVSEYKAMLAADPHAHGLLANKEALQKLIAERKAAGTLVDDGARPAASAPAPAPKPASKAAPTTPAAAPRTPAPGAQTVDEYKAMLAMAGPEYSRVLSDEATMCKLIAEGRAAGTIA